MVTGDIYQTAVAVAYSAGLLKVCGYNADKLYDDSHVYIQQITTEN